MRRTVVSSRPVYQPAEKGNRLCLRFCYNPKTDVRVINDGGLMVGFRTGTNAAGEWFRNNVDAANRQRLGAVLWIDHRYADQIIENLADAGFTMEYE